jgi:hypothetical protein
VRRLKDGFARTGLSKTLLARRLGLGRTTVAGALSTNADVASPTTVSALARFYKLPEDEQNELLQLQRVAKGSGHPSAAGGADSAAPVLEPAPERGNDLVGSAAGGAQLLSAADRSKSDRVLAALPPQAGWLRALLNPHVLPIHYTEVAVKFDMACARLHREAADFTDAELHAVYSSMVEAMTALESFMDARMYGPDPHWPWRNLTRHPLDRKRDVPLLANARRLFAQKYRAWVNELNRRELLPPDAAGAVELVVSDAELGRRRAQTDAARTALSALDALPASPADQYDRWITYMTVDSVEKSLGPRDDEGAKAWEERRRTLIGDLQVSAVDITDPGLRVLLDQVRTVLQTCEGPWKAYEQTETRTRQIAVRFAVEALGAFRRGEPLPAASGEYEKTLGAVSDFIAEWNASGL